jgi:hypothetical protein
MSWTYSFDPTASTKDAIRFLVGDTVSTDPLVSDEEIAFSIAQEGSTYYAAAAVCKAIAGKFARSVQKSDGTLSIMSQQRYEQYLKLADTLRARGRLDIQAPFVGGIDQAEHDSNEQNYGESLVTPFFRKDMWPAPGGSTPQTDITR